MVISEQKTNFGLLEELQAVNALNIKEGVRAARYTTYAIGGMIPVLLEPESRQALVRTVAVLKKWKYPWQILGAGSNLLVSEGALNFAVIRLGREFRYVRSLNSNTIEVGAAASLMSLSRRVSSNGLSGLEFAGGIPGSVGGAVRMNAGAHGGQMSDVLEQVDILTSDLNFESLSARELEFGYRKVSIAQDAIILGGTLRLIESDPQTCLKKRTECLAYRKATQPLTLPSAGSVFRNPQDGPTAGELIEACGLKGLSRGGAQISEKHANWIVNPERKASYEDVVFLINKCRSEVLSRYGIELLTEIVKWQRVRD
ncbi:MAG: UDP-N-acetylmuramate dehydrogenase [Candidatus Dadabacteria bacterium]|nr:MAG: UDP-N-acetylmuramate dehydrogenase [Candidatus Dadabacteria bacterium]